MNQPFLYELKQANIPGLHVVVMGVHLHVTQAYMYAPKTVHYIYEHCDYCSYLVLIKLFHLLQCVSLYGYHGSKHYGPGQTAPK